MTAVDKLIADGENGTTVKTLTQTITAFCPLCVKLALMVEVCANRFATLEGGWAGDNESLGRWASEALTEINRIAEEE